MSYKKPVFVLMFLILSPIALAQQSRQQPSGPAAESISTNYREPAQDPFFDPEKMVKDKTKVPTVIEVVPWPSYEERELEWKAKREEARRSGRPEPAPSERYLIEELQIMGLYKKSDGSGAFIKPKPSASAMLYASVGQKFYNGSIQRIEGNQIIVEEISRYSNGKIKTETKTLRFTRGK
ncbi:MAG: hypothetical protein RMM17_11765 [Acidobacteriota bacterium]|nr:hypothetical protein [Blastocatellia bacterium]MDW8413350.1 hypothetical protein [Acidobacteriota bacterium]